MSRIPFLIAAILLVTAPGARAQNDSAKAFLTKVSDQIKGRYTSFVKDSATLSIALSADELARSSKDATGQAAISEQLGYYYWISDPDKCISYFKKAYTFYTEVNNKNRAAMSLQNVAFSYQEHKHDAASAIPYTKRAIIIRTEMNDTLNMANMYKYLGLLQGKMHDYAAAKQNEAQAIKLYTIKKVMPAVAVCYRDLAKVYEEERNLDSCIACMLTAKDIWREHGNDTFRLFDANNILLRAYTAQNKLKEADKVFSTNQAMLISEVMQDMDRTYLETLEFYTISQAYFGKKNDDKSAKEYAAKYDAYKSTLKQNGIDIDKL